MDGKRRDTGLGSYPSVLPKEAKDRARQFLRTVYDGGDPLEIRKRQADARNAQQAEEAHSTMTFQKCALEYFNKRVAVVSKSPKTTQQFMGSMKNYVFPKVGDVPIDTFDKEHVRKVFDPIWGDKPDLSSRILGRVKDVIGWAIANELRGGSNPAEWSTTVKFWYNSPSKLHNRGHFPALPYVDLPDFIAGLLQRKVSNSSLALQFLILTAARSAEVRGATWDEIDFDKGVWIQAADRTKTGREHRVPLSKQALGILDNSPRIAGTDVNWPGTSKPIMNVEAFKRIITKMDEASIKEGGDGWRDPKVNRPATPHGYRSTFRDWVGEETSWDREVAETALAHNVGNAVERAYRRGDSIEKRRPLMQERAGFAYRTC